MLNRGPQQVTKHEDREALFAELTAAPGVLWATSEVASGRIDEINILEATKEAMSVRNCLKRVEQGRCHFMVHSFPTSPSEKLMITLTFVSTVRRRLLWKRACG